MPLVEVLTDQKLTPAIRKQLTQQIKEQVKKILNVDPERIQVIFYTTRTK